ncbi:hypothetical protein BDR22DRAFT_870410 [Usnea florida]
MLLHPAFQNRVQGWIATYNITEDRTGHGTYVCGSVLGGDVTINGDRVIGTAPRG